LEHIVTNKKLFYHFTQSHRLASILREGLKPVAEEERNYIFLLGDNSPGDVVWLTGSRETNPVDVVCDVCITVRLSPKDKRLHYWPTWLKQHMPDLFSEIEAAEKSEHSLDNEILRNEFIWRDVWVYEGTIAPSMIPMMLPHFSERASALAEQMMRMAANEPVEMSFAECGFAAMFVMAAFVALIEDDETRTTVIDGMSKKVGELVEANRKEMAAHAAAN
jgi:hypothetical protein